MLCLIGKVGFENMRGIILAVHRDIIFLKWDTSRWRSTFVHAGISLKCSG